MNPLLPFEWIAAVRFLKEGRAQTVLTIVGASVGVAVVVFMSALLLAVQANIFTRILSTQPHIAIAPPKDEARPLRDPKITGEIATIQAPAQKLRSIDQWQKIRLTLQALPEVVVVSPSASGAAFAVRGDASKAITLNGIESEHYYKIVNLPEKIISGSAQLGPNDMLVGNQLAINLGVGLGEKIHIRSDTGTDEWSPPHHHLVAPGDCWFRRTERRLTPNRGTSGPQYLRGEHRDGRRRHCHAGDRLDERGTVQLRSTLTVTPARVVALSIQPTRSGDGTHRGHAQPNRGRQDREYHR